METSKNFSTAESNIYEAIIELEKIQMDVVVA
jgi:hypothetical protein